MLKTAVGISLALSLAAPSVGAEIGSMEGAGIHGIGLADGAESQFILRATAMWGGYKDAAAPRISDGVADLLSPLPTSGFHHEQWRLSSPYGDNWTARFTTTLAVPADGEYTFYFQSDDGCRVWIDDQQIMDDWVPRSNLTTEASIALTAGDHPVRAEYLEIGGGAQAHFRWKGPGIDEQVLPESSTSADGEPGWKAEYFLNPDLEGEPALSRLPTIDVDWGSGGPDVFQAGPPVIDLHWARIGDGVIVGQLRAPQRSHAGLLLESLASEPLAYNVWGDDLVALRRDPGIADPVAFRLRALGDSAVYSASEPGAPSVWAPGDEPLIFLAGYGDLPRLTRDQATSALIGAIVSGANAPVPPGDEDGWISLFNGKDVTGWHLRHPGGAKSWSVEGDELVNAGHGTDIYHEVRLTDFEVQFEFNVPEGSNSGIYLQRRYEVQIHDSFGLDPNPSICGGIYSQAAPSVNAFKPAGEWQTMTVTFRSARPSLSGGLASPARVTVVQNGVRVIDDFELLGPTGGEMDRDEGKAAGIMLQGDHGAIRVRDIRVRPIP